MTSKILDDQQARRELLTRHAKNHTGDDPFTDTIRTVLRITGKPSLFRWGLFEDLAEAVRVRDGLALGDLSWVEVAPDMIDDDGDDIARAVLHERYAELVESLLDRLLEDGMQ